MQRNTIQKNSSKAHGDKTIFFVQKSPALAGAQKALLRLARSINGWSPILITSKDGWLTEECKSNGIPVIVHPFPSSRSLEARLIGNRLFARSVAKQCRNHSSDYSLVHGNDHIQSLTSLAIAHALKAPSIVSLRTSRMEQRDFFKYGCHRHARIVAVGHELYRHAGQWYPSSQLRLIEDGIDAGEINPHPICAQAFPRSVLVLGSAEPNKGWRDVVDALAHLEAQGQGADIEFVFLGNDCGKDVYKAVGAERLKTFRIRHLPVTRVFQDTVRAFELAIHPSHMESFGLALIETLAAGVPVLSSRTGAAGRVIDSPDFLFEPRNIKELAAKISGLLKDFSTAPTMVSQAQDIIRRRYCTSRTAAEYTRIYDETIGLNT
ncbi:MAG: glycosyltransferase family 4 protein [Verrucomicrobia bacterium]|nr:glycosyltransferase family 4 protein [Verrucomicrobiota bacterium]